MRIAYLLQMADLATENGIAKKIFQQATAWTEAGSTVKIFTQANQPGIWCDFADVAVEVFPKKSLHQRFLRSLRLCESIRHWKPDVIYYRYAYHAPGLPTLFRDFPTIAEINSDDQKEYPLTLGYLKNLYHRLSRHRVLQAMAGFCPVTHELAERFSEFQRPQKVIGNAISLKLFDLLPIAENSSRLRLAFIGSPRTPWHGLDRLGELASLVPNICIDIIGCELSDYTAVSSAAPCANLTFHGHLSRARYESILSQATAAIGTLGLYRKGMHEACPLKVREYLALGLPVIGGCADTDIPDNAGYYLRLPNDDAPLAPYRETITAFIEHWRDRRVGREAIAHLDTSAKETARLAFMERVVAEWRTPHGSLSTTLS